MLIFLSYRWSSLRAADQSLRGDSLRRFVLPDEDAWVLPAAWREGLSPRPGGLHLPDQASPTAAAGSVAEASAAVDRPMPQADSDGTAFDQVGGNQADQNRPGSVLPVLAGPPRRADGKPLRVPDLPEWMVLPALPAVPLRDGGDALTQDAVRNLCALLAVSKIAAAHPAITDVRAACDPRSLAGFAWAIFEQWQAAQYPAKSSLAMVALALLGDDTTVPALTSLFPGWASTSIRVRTGMDVLAAIGTDLALTHLHRLSRKAKTVGFRRLAEKRLNDVAAARGLQPAQLADRIVPDFGLDANGRTVLDYGPRRFTVAFDERFQPWYTDQWGRRLARMVRLPRRTAADDQNLVQAARRRYTELTNDLTATVTERSRAIEEAMVLGRRWTGAEYRSFFVDHPLTWHLTRRLLWATFDERGEVVTAFRGAEDRTFADIDDKTWTLDPAATVGVAHPWHFDRDRAAWAEIFANYLIIQPFPQVGRELFSLADLDLNTVAGAPVESGKLNVLTARGWRFGDGHSSLERDWPGDRTIRIGFSPGYSWDEPDLPQHLAGVRGEVADLGPVGISEVVRDVRSLMSWKWTCRASLALDSPVSLPRLPRPAG
ncbi:DUF4132 domain-containing protein [Micromonospora sp. NPDC047074]|uniref:DUF4132 domain-containing protein n=1 Tax=Micromonospora sp. NPDC047074 TaxID=3154339 RepID=UPI0033E25BE4